MKFHIKNKIRMHMRVKKTKKDFSAILHYLFLFNCVSTNS